jgi:stearoyl-CoA desaturase (delta-9 desaturase)
MTFHHKLLALIFVNLALMCYAISQEFAWYYILFAWLGSKIFNAIGHEIGMHRLWTHRSFNTTRLKEFILHLFATPLLYGSSITYVGVHRHHHMYADTEKDSHIISPWYSMLFYKRNKNYNINPKLVADVIKDPYHKFFHKNYFYINVLILILCLALLGPVITGWSLSFMVVYNWLAACALNVLGHTPALGYRKFNTVDRSANNTVLQFLFWGVGLHNNHHANPSSWTVKTTKYEVDFPGFLIKHFFKK